jgi:hypothetical protein
MFNHVVVHWFYLFIESKKCSFKYFGWHAFNILSGLQPEPLESRNFRVAV